MYNTICPARFNLELVAESLPIANHSRLRFDSLCSVENDQVVAMLYSCLHMHMEWKTKKTKLYSNRHNRLLKIISCHDSFCQHHFDLHYYKLLCIHDSNWAIDLFVRSIKEIQWTDFAILQRYLHAWACYVRDAHTCEDAGDMGIRLTISGCR